MTGLSPVGSSPVGSITSGGGATFTVDQLASTAISTTVSYASLAGSINPNFSLFKVNAYTVTSPHPTGVSVNKLNLYIVPGLRPDALSLTKLNVYTVLSLRPDAVSVRKLNLYTIIDESVSLIRPQRRYKRLRQTPDNWRWQRPTKRYASDVINQANTGPYVFVIT